MTLFPKATAQPCIGICEQFTQFETSSDNGQISQASGSFFNGAGGTSGNISAVSGCDNVQPHTQHVKCAGDITFSALHDGQLIICNGSGTLYLLALLLCWCFIV